MIKPFSWLLIIVGFLAMVGEVCQVRLPTVGAIFSMCEDFRWMRFADPAPNKEGWPWFGWLWSVVIFSGGIYFAFLRAGKSRQNPLAKRRWERFRSIKRGYNSLLIIIIFIFLAGLDFVLVGSEALAVRYKGEWSFPAFTQVIEKGKLYGVEGDGASAPAEYRQLKLDFEVLGGEDKVIMPLVPYEPAGEHIAALASPLKVKKKLLYKERKPFSGLASKLYDINVPERQHLRFRYRKGKKEGRADGWNREGALIYSAEYKKNKLVEGSEKWLGEGDMEDFLKGQSDSYYKVNYPPAPPSPGHLLGTNSQGNDVVAYLFGGLQVNIQAALLYIPFVYFIGITVGLLMGFFGGIFDLLIQRVIEVLSNIPFLLVVMIVSVSVPEGLKEKAGLWIIISILAVFNWMGMTYLMRTSALKEKARDYIAASRVMGASTWRILFRHLLPNSMSILVTIIPFSVSSVVMSLASLDYLGFGLPAKYATWGKLLRDGLENLSSPWLVSSAFGALTLLLLLVVFVGEAVREAFDPKKYSYYK